MRGGGGRADLEGVNSSFGTLINFYLKLHFTAVARSFRMFGKKRGHRHTGSKTLRSAGEALFFALLLILGAAFLFLLLSRTVIPEWRANHEFVETTAVVLDKRVEQRSDRDGNPVFAPKARIHYEQAPDDVWTYDIAGTTFSNAADAQGRLDRLTIGQTYPCWYDPMNPEAAVLVRGYSLWFWMLLLVPLGFMLIGGGALAYLLWHWGRSPEHQAARGQLGRIDLFEEMDARAKDYPTIPHDTDLTNSPGTHLKYRLPSSNSQGWRLLGATGVCAVWNGIVAVFIVLAVRKHLHGEGDWRLDWLVVPFLLIGGFLIYYFVRELLIVTGIGQIFVEISDHPLLPGGRYEVYMVQGGHLWLKAIDVFLECEEQAAYRQGTDTRTDRRVVHRQSLFHQENVETLPGQPLETQCEMHVPDTAMHSFTADNNLVQWKLTVRADAEGWPPFERSFRIVVYPPRVNMEISNPEPQNNPSIPNSQEENRIPV
jgi:hypothetical protein